jgi:hypothetical protein
VGYLELRGFSDAGDAGPTALAAMRFLAHGSALIVDLRHDGGGSPSMIQLISSHFFDGPRHLNTFYVRRTDSRQQFWTQANVPGPKMVDTPIYVLTSGRTFSARRSSPTTSSTWSVPRSWGRRRAVARTWSTPWSPNMGDGFHARVSLPFGRAINPITGTNWEGTGVEPHVKVPAAESLGTAHELALDELSEGETDPARRAALEWARDEIRSRREPVELSRREAAALVGDYGPRRVSLASGRLHDQRDGGAKHVLTAMGDDRFRVGELDFFRLRFERNAAGRVVRLEGQYSGGRTDAHERAN